MADIAGALLRVAETRERHEGAAGIMFVVGNQFHPVGSFSVRQVYRIELIREGMSHGF